LTGGAVQAPGYASPYLLTSFARCAVCGGPLGTISRMHGTGAKRRPARFYGGIEERLIEDLMPEQRASVDESILRDVIAGAVARRRAQQGSAESRRPIVARELREVDQRITRLVDAIANTGPVEELLDHLRAERARKAALIAEQRGMEGSSTGRDTDLQARVTAVVAKLRQHLAVQVARTRQLLGALLLGPVLMVPILEAGRRGYRCKGRLRLDGLLAGEALETSHVVVAPRGFDQVTSYLELDFEGLALAA
jgi:hypothetical protein